MKIEPRSFVHPTRLLVIMPTGLSEVLHVLYTVHCDTIM